VRVVDVDVVEESDWGSSAAGLVPWFPSRRRYELMLQEPTLTGVGEYQPVPMCPYL